MAVLSASHALDSSAYHLKLDRSEAYRLQTTDDRHPPQPSDGQPPLLAGKPYAGEIAAAAREAGLDAALVHAVINVESAYRANAVSGKGALGLMQIMPETAHRFCNEFNSRLFELYLHAVFYELDFEMDRSFAQHDFLLRKAGQTISIEATTVAETNPDSPPMAMDETSLNDLQTYVREQMPFKCTRTLRKKMRHRPEPAEVHYWKLPRTQGYPFILAVHDYSRCLSMTMSPDAMRNYLYGTVFENGRFESIDVHVNGDERLTSNFLAARKTAVFPQSCCRQWQRFQNSTAWGKLPVFLHRTPIASSSEKEPTNVEYHTHLRLKSMPRVTESSGTKVSSFFTTPMPRSRLIRNYFPDVHFKETEDGYEQWLPPNYLISGTTLVIKTAKGDAPRSVE